MDKSLGLLAALAAGVGLYFIAENTPEGKKVISNIHQSISNIKTGITEVSTTPTVPDLGAGRCPKGMYLDQTDGIYRCHSAGRIRELNPNVKTFSPQWQNAWAAEPNMTQPLVTPDINKQIESEIKKKHEKEVRHQKNLDSKRLIREKGNVVAAQVECPKDLKDVPCGGHCYKNGHLMAVDCSGQRNKDKINKKPSLVIPPNFPNQVVITPGEEPYPEDTEAGVPETPTDTNPSYPPNQLFPPDQQQILPTVPPTSPTPIAPPQRVTGQLLGHLNQMWDKVNCKPAGGSPQSCRRQGNVSQVGANPRGPYKLVADVTLTKPLGKDMEITSGGPGSSDNCCCGVSLGVHHDGYVYAKTEDWTSYGKSHGHAKYLCDDSGKNHVGRCNQNPQRANLPVGQPIRLTWQVQQSGSDYIYSGTMNGVPVAVKNPASWDGKKIIPGIYNGQCSKQPSDPTRVRVDGDDSRVSFGNGLAVYSIANAYYGDLGYIDEEDFLI